MAPRIITFGISKGGCSKTTTAAIVANQLKKDHKVLAIDMDSQGNLTSLLTNVYDTANEFFEQTVLEGILNRDVTPYIVNVDKNLDLIPSNDYLVMIHRSLDQAKMGLDCLSRALKPVMDDYDYIIIDTPPNLGNQTIISLSVNSEAGHYAVILNDGGRFAFHAIINFIDILNATKETFNPNLKIGGILMAITDDRSKEYDSIKNLIDADFPGLRFDTIVKKRAATKRLPIFGFEENPELTKAIEQYQPFIEELIERVETETGIAH